jgi:DNA-binding NarL/FixJ family response regulator
MTIPEFTPRQWDVLRALCEVKTNSEIAYDLGISPHTVKAHVERLMQATGTRNRVELILTAVRRGWVTFEVQP